MTDRVGGAEAVKALERTGWSEKADTYGLLTGRITAPARGVTARRRRSRRGHGRARCGNWPGLRGPASAERGAVATGVDIAEEMVALARSRNGAIRFLRADAEELPFPDRSFDALVGNLVVNHLPKPARARSASSCAC